MKINQNNHSVCFNPLQAILPHSALFLFRNQVNLEKNRRWRAIAFLPQQTKLANKIAEFENYVVAEKSSQFGGVLYSMIPTRIYIQYRMIRLAGW